MTDRDYNVANDESRRRLRELVESLTLDDYARPVGGGWTVASVLGHTGFWDRYQAARWREILAGGAPGAGVDIVPAEDLANEALEPIWALLDAAEVGRMAVEAAQTLDAIVARAPQAIVEQLDGTTNEYLLRRHRHRMEHVEQAQRALGSAGE